MSLPNCPICGREVFDSIQQQGLSASQAEGKTEVQVVVCHCAESHRFLVSLREDVLARAPANEYAAQRLP